METALAIDDSILLLLTVIAAVALVVSLTSEPSSKKDESRPQADQASRWRVFRILPEVLHDHETEKSAVVADEVGGVCLVAHPFAGQGWEFSQQGNEHRAGKRGARERPADDFNLEITRRGILTSRFHVILDGKPWLSVGVDKGARSMPEIRRHDRGESLKIAGSPHQRDYEVRRNGKLVAMVSDAPPTGAREPKGDYTLEVLRSEDPKPLLTLVLCVEAALPPRQ